MSDKYMSNEIFKELLESVREGGAILRGMKEASRKVVIETPDKKEIYKRQRRNKD